MARLTKTTNESNHEGLSEFQEGTLILRRERAIQPGLSFGGNIIIISLRFVLEFGIREHIRFQCGKAETT
jgi:hypothetical protein